MRTKIRTTVRLRAYDTIMRAVEEGVRYGVTHAFKHTDAPGLEALVESTEAAVISSLCEVLDFEAE